MIDKEISIVLSGEAGQGLNTIEPLFITLLEKAGYHAFLSKEFMSRVRGGNNTTAIRVSSGNVDAFVDRIDLLIVLGPNAIGRLEKRLAPGTILIGEEKNIPQKYADMGCRLIPVDFEARLSDLGGNLFLNNLILGLLVGLLDCDTETARSMIRSRFIPKGETVVEKNLAAFDRGLDVSEQISLPISIQKDGALSSRIVLSGTESVGIGAIAGGCNFIASYPMSPGTGVLAYLARRSKECDIVVEQAEDEIAAVNMMLGAWYAGARGMVTTSGGGFALMTEGLSLAGCIESPAVIHLAQRPGPATGMPTRTEQGDLNLALYAGHGEFPRILYAPGTIRDTLVLAQKAFEVADRFQVPVILLTDQYLLDGIGLLEKPSLSPSPADEQIVETRADYQRYALTPSGISPRGIPGYGSGFVCVDSDEHDEDGRITEDFDMRVAMVDKRLRKLADYEDLEPELIGNRDYHTLIVGWGSSGGMIAEALSVIDRSGVAFAWFKQIYPVPKNAGKLLEQASKRIVVENNATGQFAKLIEMETRLEIHGKILKYNGMPFSVEELVTRIKGELS